jgi:LysM repeat protein
MPAPGPGASLAGTAGDPSLTQQPVDTTPNVPSKEYKVQARDTLSAIATKNGASLSAIMKLNPTLDPKKLRVGQSIKIPIAGAGSTMAAGTASTPPTGSLGTTAGAVSGTAGGTYKVKAGDTLTKIARTHGITVNQLRAANNMKTTQVQVGKVLKIPARTQKTAAADTNTTQH